MSADETQGRILETLTRVEVELGHLRKQRDEDKQARDKTHEEERADRLEDKAAQALINLDIENRVRDLKNAQEQRKGISGVAGVIFGALGGSVAAFFLGQWVAHPTATPTTPQMQTNCGTFVVVGSVCPAGASSSKSPSTSTPKSSTAPEVDRRISTAVNHPTPQQPSKRVAVGQQKAITNPKAKAKKPIAKARVKKGGPKK